MATCACSVAVNSLLMMEGSFCAPCGNVHICTYWLSYARQHSQWTVVVLRHLNTIYIYSVCQIPTSPTRQCLWFGLVDAIKCIESEEIHTFFLIRKRHIRNLDRNCSLSSTNLVSSTHEEIDTLIDNLQHMGFGLVKKNYFLFTMQICVILFLTILIILQKF